MSMIVDFSRVERLVNALVAAGKKGEAALAKAVRRSVADGYLFLRDGLRGQNKSAGKFGLKYRSGALFRSIMQHIDADGLTGSIFSDSKSALVHELGTVGAGGSLPDIVSKRPGGMLAIPLPESLTASGRIKAKFAVDTLRSVKGLFILRGAGGQPVTTSSGNLILAYSEGKRVKPAFVLARKSRMPRRPFFAPTAKFLQTRIEFNMSRAIGETFRFA